MAGCIEGEPCCRPDCEGRMERVGAETVLSVEASMSVEREAPVMGEPQVVVDGTRFECSSEACEVSVIR